jgi:hypothetical protein
MLDTSRDINCWKQNTGMRSASVGEYVGFDIGSDYTGQEPENEKKGYRIENNQTTS